jgi:hypothetical protein
MIARPAHPACAVILSLGIAALLFGCGSGGDDSSTSASAGRPAVPQPRQQIAQRVPDLEQAASSLDCEDALGVIHQVVLPDPSGGQSKANCAAAVSTLRNIQGFKASDSADFGSAALVDAQVGGQERSLYWVMDDSGDLKWIGTALVGHQIGTHPLKRIDYEAPVDAFLRALREEDCKAAFAQLMPGSRVSYGDQKTFCSKFRDTFTADSESFGTLLQNDPEAHPVKLGSTLDATFYGVATKPNGYRTLIVNPVNGTAKIYDVIRGPDGGGN